MSEGEGMLLGEGLSVGAIHTQDIINGEKLTHQIHTLHVRNPDLSFSAAKQTSAVVLQYSSHSSLKNISICKKMFFNTDGR